MEGDGVRAVLGRRRHPLSAAAAEYRAGHINAHSLLMFSREERDVATQPAPSGAVLPLRFPE